MATVERVAETAAVKAALVKAGYTQVSVKHGTGTAWGWLRLNVTTAKPADCSCATYVDQFGRPDTCRECRLVWGDHYGKAVGIAQDVTGRRGEYSGKINAAVALV